MNTNSVINPGQGLPVDPNSIPASLTNDPEGFKKFDSYPWEKDRQFLVSQLLTFDLFFLSSSVTRLFGQSHSPAYN